MTAIRQYGKSELEKLFGDSVQQEKDRQGKNSIAESFFRGEIHLWRLSWEKLEDFCRNRENILSEEEKQKAETFRFPEDRQRSRTARIILRLLLSFYLGEADPKAIVLETGEHGKPFHRRVSRGKQIHFNLSHSGAYVMLAFSSAFSVGVDIQEVRDVRNWRNIAERFFSERDAAAVTAADDPDLFFRYWAAKEAYIKALGMGLYKDLRFFSVGEDCIREGEELQGKWKLHSWLEDGYACCVAWEE